MSIAWIESLVERFGASPALIIAGIAVGLAFGFFAQRSRFCLRAAVVEFITGHLGEKLAIWLLAFGAAILGIQALIAAGLVDVSGTRTLAARGSLSGAIAGGLVFGAGMILSRGCASRLLVLSATGNLRALVTGLVFVVAAQAAWQGALEPLRTSISTLWTIEGGAARDAMALLGGREADKLPLAALWFAIATLFAIRGRVSRWGWIGGIGAGLAVAAAYLLTHQIGLAALEAGTARGVTFSGPSAEFLMRVLLLPEKAPGFDTLLVPGVFLGAALGAILFREWRLSVFDTQSGMLRYILGAVLMGFGSMTAGGCAVGAGVSGGAIFSLTAWLALLGMWVGAGATHWIIDEERKVDTVAALPVDMIARGAVSPASAIALGPERPRS